MRASPGASLPACVLSLAAEAGQEHWEQRTTSPALGKEASSGVWTVGLWEAPGVGAGVPPSQGLHAAP